MTRKIIPWLLVIVASGIAGVWANGSLTPREMLGKELFFDENLSANVNQSCASCHGPEVGFTGPLSDINEHGAVYEGSVAGLFGNRKPPSAAYATQSPIFHRTNQGGGGLFEGGNFWDGRATGEKLGNPAADQAQGPFLNPLEQALGSPADVIERVCAGAYAGLFVAVCGETACDPDYTDAAYDCVGLSIAAYEASPEVNAFSSKFDYYRRGMAMLTAEEMRGLQLFKGKAKCARCHIINAGGEAPPRPVSVVGTVEDPTNSSFGPSTETTESYAPAVRIDPVFTDYTFDNLGVPRNPENPFYWMDEFNPAGEDWIDVGLGGFLESRMDYAQWAYDAMGQHKVPTLRNVDKRPYPGFVKAFGHNGYFKSLEEIVHFYNTRDVLPVCPDGGGSPGVDCWPPPEVAMNVNDSELGDLRLSEAEEAAIVAFMKTLTDGYTP